MTVFAVRHRTTYRYRDPVRLGEHRLLCRPRDSYDQRLIETSLHVEPEPKAVHWTHDVFGNCVAHIAFATPARELVFDSVIRLEHTPNAAPDFRIDEAALAFPFSYDREEFVNGGAKPGRWAAQK